MPRLAFAALVAATSVIFALLAMAEFIAGTAFDDICERWATRR